MDGAGTARKGPLCPHGTGARVRWCERCLRTVAVDLLALPALYRDREACLFYTSDDGAMRICTRIVGVLSAWCALVVCERGEISPGALVVENMAVFLDMNLRWLAAHRSADEFAAAVREPACATDSGTVPPLFAERMKVRVDHV